jgi:hypothetical protein
MQMPYNCRSASKIFPYSIIDQARPNQHTILLQVLHCCNHTSSSHAGIFAGLKPGYKLTDLGTKTIGLSTCWTSHPSEPRSTSTLQSEPFCMHFLHTGNTMRGERRQLEIDRLRVVPTQFSAAPFICTIMLSPLSFDHALE